eukprot:gene7789-15932_t
MIKSRKDLSKADIIVIKAGTSVVSTPEGYPCISRMASLVECAVQLSRENKKVIIVTSGAVGVGRQRLQKQLLKQCGTENVFRAPSDPGYVSYNSACAAAGQLGLMSLYETMFSQYDVSTSQLLVTCFDFENEERRKNIKGVLLDLLSHGIVPVINENDAVSANQGYKLFGNDTFSDNDALAAIISGLLSAQLMVLLTDVAGVFDRPPTEPGARLIDIFDEDKSKFVVGDKSAQGRGGMAAKVDAALRALDNGVDAAIIAPGGQHDVMDRILAGKQAGTLFLKSKRQGISDGTGTGSNLMTGQIQLDEGKIEDLAQGARALDSAGRERILHAIADALESRQDEIMAVNVEDVSVAENSGLAGPMLSRLKLTSEKMRSLVHGIRTLLADGLCLDKITAPIGVLLIIFESRPDCLPQIAALAIRSGNGLLLKGGKEAEKSNALLHRIIADAIAQSSEGRVSGNAIGLVTSRSEIASLLKLGSGDLVKYIKDNTRIPVMGHADGICHLYIHHDANASKATKLAVCGKTDYPSACNATETILLHIDTVSTGLARSVVDALTAAGVTIRGGERAIAEGLLSADCERVENFKTEYGDLTVSLEVVESKEEAVEHINTYG